VGRAVLVAASHEESTAQKGGREQKMPEARHETAWRMTDQHGHDAARAIDEGDLSRGQSPPSGERAKIGCRTHATSVDRQLKIVRKAS
jgi:hypothetical protein